MFYHDMHTGLVTRLWQAGFIVVSLDQRGWGDSGGRVDLMNPEKEVRDVSTVLTWALTHLPVLWREGRPMVGAVGGSYGGGFQTLLAFLDPRVQAITPWVTWYDLRYSLAPNGVVKSLHADALYTGGTLYGRMEPWITQAFLEAQAGRLSRETMDRLYKRSPARFYEDGRIPHADAFFVQGAPDTLFNLTEGYWNLRCFQERGRDARLWVVPNGHLIPEIQGPPASSFCGPLDPFEAVVAWYREKLKGEALAASRIPRVCADLGGGTAYQGEDLPFGGKAFTLPPQSFFLPSPQGLFAPLWTPEEDVAVVGLPQVELELEAIGPDPILFLGLAVGKEGRFKALNDQFLPLRGKGSYRGLLPGVSGLVKGGETLGLLLTGFRPEYFSHGSRLPALAHLQGRVEVPVVTGR
ncbi:hypothetical protein FJNA_21070 [Thermus sp. FJN-A]